MNISYQQFGPASILLAVATTVTWWFYCYPPRWFRRWCEAKRTVRVVSTTTPQGIPELGRCRKQFVI